MNGEPSSAQTEPLDWYGWTLESGEACVPFAHYVQPDTKFVVESSFRLFPRFPRELQLRIIKCCDQATLFQLMRVSSSTRDEARQLFWSNRDAWYRIDGEWLLKGGYTGHTFYNVDFLSNVRQVDVQFDAMRIFESSWDDGERVARAESPSWTVHERVHTFWALLLEKCPRVAHVIVSETIWPRDDLEPLNNVHEMLLSKCPATVSVSASSIYQAPYHNPATSAFVRKRRLWKEFKSQDSMAGNWVVVDSDCKLQCILPPPKEFRGPVGAYQRMWYDNQRFVYHYESLSRLRIEAIERHYFGSGHGFFTCPAPTCLASFNQPGQWPSHANASRHQFDAEVPLEFAAQFAELEKRVDTIWRKDRGREAMRTEWGSDGTEQRRSAENAFLCQLEHDILFTCSKPPRQTSFWKFYQRDMNPEHDNSLR